MGVGIIKVIGVIRVIVLWSWEADNIVSIIYNIL